MKFELLEFYVLPPAEALDSSYAIVAYQTVKSQNIHHGPNPSQLSKFAYSLFERHPLYSHLFN